MGALICIISLVVSFGLGYTIYPKIFTDYNKHANVIEEIVVNGPDGQTVFNVDVNNLTREELPHELKILTEGAKLSDGDNTIVLKAGETVKVQSYYRGVVEVSYKEGKYLGELDYFQTDLIKQVARYRLNKKSNPKKPRKKKGK